MELQHNVIKRNTVTIKGTVIINTSMHKAGDEIIARKKEGGWSVFNTRTGECAHGFPDFIRRFVNITEQSAERT